MYKLRYGRTYNMGNYQSERIEIEHDFPDNVTLDEAVNQEIHEVEQIHEASVDYLRAKSDG